MATLNHVAICALSYLTQWKCAYTTDELGTPIDTIEYSYYPGTWRDKLVSFDGNEIAYDNVGNPYRDGTWRYTWERGRQLAAMTSMADTAVYWNYDYDVNGMRTGRTNGTDTYTYVYNGGQLVSMTKNNDTLYFSYDASGVMSVTYNGTVYQYVTNMQGDIVAIISPLTGEAVVEYTYDAWGNILSTGGSMKDTLGAINPLRYRGYVYDTETGLYYLQSRYYNPTWGRFINADAIVSTGQNLVGSNMFAYCGNNPVIRKDTAGQFWEYTEYSIAKRETTLVEEKDDERVYYTTISYTATTRCIFGCRPFDPYTRYKVSFKYSITNSGVVLYDNKQSASSHLDVSKVRNVQHGKNYFTFYCKLGTVSVKVGDKVVTGQVLGTMETLSGQNQMHFELWKDNVPQNQMHFELWKDNVPQNPASWIR